MLLSSGTQLHLDCSTVAYHDEVYSPVPLGFRVGDVVTRWSSEHVRPISFDALSHSVELWSIGQHSAHTPDIFKPGKSGTACWRGRGSLKFANDARHSFEALTDCLMGALGADHAAQSEANLHKGVRVCLTKRANHYECIVEDVRIDLLPLVDALAD